MSMPSNLKHIPKRRLGTNGPEVSAIGLGTMAVGDTFYGKTDEQEMYKVLSYAADRGVTFWDCSDIYGRAESVLGDWFTTTNRRSDIFLSTKFGSWNPEDPKTTSNPALRLPNSAPSYIPIALERSLRRLQTTYIDLYYQHRVDPYVPIEIMLEALRGPLEQGKIRWIGLCECDEDVIRRAKRVPGIVGEKVVVVQMEYSPFSLEIEKSGFAEEARRLGIGIVAYSPLARGLATGRFKSPADFGPDDFRRRIPRFSEENFPKNLAISNKLQAIAEKYNTTTAQVTLAWILAEHPNFIPIPGSRSIARLEENASAAELHLVPDDVQAIRTLVDAAEIHGERYPSAQLLRVGSGCIALEAWMGEEERERMLKEQIQREAGLGV